MRALGGKEVPSYTLFDVGASYTRSFRGSEVTLRLTGQTIADERHFSPTGANLVAQAPSRTLKLSVSTRF